jgi:hypothetical protein
MSQCLCVCVKKGLSIPPLYLSHLYPRNLFLFCSGADDYVLFLSLARAGNGRNAMCLEVSVTTADEFQRKGKARWTRRRREIAPTALRGGYAVRDEDDDDMVACVAVSHDRYCG